MTTFQPLDPVPGEVTVQNDGNVATSYAVEVSIGRTLPQGFQAESSRLVFTDILEPGETANVPVPVTIPSQVEAGPKTVRVRLGTPSFLGTIQRVLGQEFYSNRLNVTIPQEIPMPPGPPEPPIPGLEPGDVSLQRPSASPSEVEPGGRVSFSIPVQVASVPGLPRPMVRVQADVIRNGQIVDTLPADEFDISSGTLNRLPQEWAVPSDAEDGPYGLRVRLWDPATVGTLGDLALSTFSGLFQVLAAGPAPGDLSQIRQGLGTPVLSASPREVNPGQSVRVFYQLPTSVPFAFNPALALDVVGPGNNVLSTPVDRQISVAPGSAIAGQFDINTGGLEPGSYGVGFSLVDPITNQSLLERTFSGLFSLRGVLPGLESPDQLQVSAPQISPSQVNPGESIRITLPVNVQVPSGQLPASPALFFEVAALRNGTQVVPFQIGDFDISSGANSLTQSMAIPGNAPAGDYSLAVRLWDPETFFSAGYLFEQQFSNAFRVLGEAPAPGPAPTPSVWRSGDLSLPAVSIPSIEPGGSVDVPLTISNPNDKRLPASIEPSLIPPTGPRVPLSPIPFTPSGPAIPIVLGFQIPQNAASGLWQLLLVVRDPAQNLTITSRTYNFQVLIPEIPPVPPPPQPDPGFRRGDISLTRVSVSDTSPEDGDRITIRVQFGVAQRPVRDEFVRVSVTVIDGNNRTVEVLPEEDFDVTIGQQNTVTFNWTVDAAPGPHGFLIRIWDPDTLSAEGILLDTRRSGVFTVAAPPAPPPAPALVSVSGPSVAPSTVAPGGIFTVEWRLRNPQSNNFRALLFLDGPGGGTGTARTFGPGETQTLEVQARMPSGASGRITYGVVVQELLTRDRISNLTRLVNVNVQQQAPPPTPGPVPTPPPEEEEEGIRSGELVAEAPSSQPLVADRGEIVDIGFTFRNQSSDGGSLNLLVFPRDPSNRARGTLRATFNVSPRGTATPTLSFRVPSDAAFGAWGVQVFVWDSRTFVGGDDSTYLVNRFYEGVFRVG